MKSMASNSVMTRARAKYGCRLKSEDYASLAGLSSLREVVTYLKTRTHFAPYFEALSSDPNLSKLRLELALRSAFEQEVSGLCSFEKSVGEPIMKYIMLDREVELILDFIINLSLGTPEKMILKTPPAFNCGTRMNFSELFQVNSAEKLVRYLAKTKYAKLVAVLPKTDDGEFDISLIEATLGRIKNKLVFEQIGKALPAETAKVLSNSIRSRIELSDFSIIYRAKKYYGLSENYIRTNLIGYRSLLSQKNTEDMIAAKTAQEVLEIFKQTRYAPKITKFGIDDPELFCKKAVLDTEIRYIHFSADPAVVLASYLRYLQTERENITKIIEGISYGVPKDEIMKNLIIIERGA